MMANKITPALAILFLFCCGCASYPGSLLGTGSSQPLLYDKFGFPIGGIYQLMQGNEFVVEDFELNLTPLVGFSCAGRNTPRVHLYMQREALIYFERMQKEALDDGIRLSICSAYRDYSAQKRLKRRYPAKALSPGYSEHHLGTTVDMINVTWNNRRYRWLSQNAYRYGYILTYYRRPELGVGEPNHWRYVGIEAARIYYDLYGALY